MPWALLAVLCGCATSQITNLTATTQPRNPTGQYLIEMAIDHRQQTLKDASITPYVVVGFDSYKMIRTPKMTNRFEAFVPVPSDKNNVVYYFKVGYDYQKFGKTGQGSRLSPEYKLNISDK